VVTFTPIFRFELGPFTPELSIHNEKNRYDGCKKGRT
jgi:hypothetical protein